MKTENLASDTIQSIRPATASIRRAGLAAMAAAVIANLVVRAILFSLLDLPDELPPLRPASIIIFTLVGTGLGVVAYALVVRRSANPRGTYLFIAAVALVLSILPNFGLMANPSAAPFPGGSAVTFGALIIFHFVAALVFVPLLLSLSQLWARKV